VSGPRRAWAAATAAAAVALLGLLACRGSGPPAPDAWVIVRGQRIAAERAIGFAQKARGLSGRDRLDWDSGMLFEYPSPGFYAFWMKDMRFDLDLVWIRGGRIVDIHHRVPAPPGPVPEGDLPVYRPREMADTILEVPAGYAAAHGWSPGDRVQVEPTRADPPG
jgi:uncharacterized protein